MVRQLTGARPRGLHAESGHARPRESRHYTRRGSAAAPRAFGPALRDSGGSGTGPFILTTRDDSTAPKRPAQRPASTRALLLVLALAIGAASLANGLSFWGKRVGWLEPPPSHDAAGEYIPPAARIDGFYETRGAWRLGKHAKDVLLVVLAVLLVCRRSLLRELAALSPPRLAAVGGALLSTLYATVLSISQFGVLFATLGARTAVVVGLAVISAPLARRLDALAPALFLPALLQVPFVLVEAVRGAPLFHSFSPVNRVVGTFLLPTTLGTYAVVSAALLWACRETPAVRCVALATALFLCILSGSGTAWVLLLSWLAWLAVSALPPTRKPLATLAGGLAAIALVLALPGLTGRPMIYDSLWGRLAKASSQLHPDGDLVAALFGRGLGVGTNMPTTLLVDETFLRARIWTESTYEALYHQFGIVGVALVLAGLALGVFGERRLRVVYVLLALCGLTLKMFEAFPLNLLLAVLLARALFGAGPETDRPGASR